MTIDIFDKIIAKHDEFYECMAHLHFRGADDVREETIKLAKKAAKMGYGGSDFKKYILSINPELRIDKDIFARGVILYLNANKNAKK